MAAIERRAGIQNPRMRPDEVKPLQEQRERRGLMANKVIVITGASRGIGRAIALTAADEGALGIVYVSRPREDGQEPNTSTQIRERGAQALWVPADLTQEGAGKAVIDAAIRKFGRIDAVVNNAGTTDDNLFIRMRGNQWENVFNLNFWPAVEVSQAAVRQMIRQKPRGGSLVFISSIAAKGNPGQANYAASKGALESFAKTIAVEYATKGIRANAVAPALADTDLTKGLTDEQRRALIDLSPMRRLILPEEVAQTVIYLASDYASATTGQVINVDGGMVRG